MHLVCSVFIIAHCDLLFPPKFALRSKTSKMADTSIAAELLSCVSLFRYRSIIPCLTKDDFVPLRTFQRSELGKLYDVDRTGCRPNGVINNSHLFELFGKYSDEDTESVRSDTLECINTGEHVYSV